VVSGRGRDPVGGMRVQGNTPVGAGRFLQAVPEGGQ